MDEPVKIIYSLHRPLSEPIWICKWVCQFINSKECPKNITLLPISFYEFLVNKLASLYENGKLSPLMQKGLPSKAAINANINFINNNIGVLDTKIHAILIKRVSEEERNVYSVYKAASYYINLAYRTFKLFDSKFKLSWDGIELVKLPKYPHTISASTKSILFNLILREDANFFIPLCIALKLVEPKNRVSNLLYPFLKDSYNIIKFDYSKSSNANYINVRLAWIEELKILDKRKNIRKSYLNYIKSNDNYKKVYFESKRALTDEYDLQLKYYNIKNKFVKIYNSLLKAEANPDGFVNLYSIMKVMHIGYARFQKFLSLFFKYEHRDNYHIFTSNVIASIDNRKRFNVGDADALYVKIIEKTR